MNLRVIEKLAQYAHMAAEDLSKIEALFACDSVDEQYAKGLTDTGRETFIEIGGPRTHARLYQLTRMEIELLRPALIDICIGRRQQAEAALKKELGSP
jgi:hypothetical protein